MRGFSGIIGKQIQPPLHLKPKCLKHLPWFRELAPTQFRADVNKTLQQSPEATFFNKKRNRALMSKPEQLLFVPRQNDRSKTSLHKTGLRNLIRIKKTTPISRRTSLLLRIRKRLHSNRMKPHFAFWVVTLEHQCSRFQSQSTTRI